MSQHIKIFEKALPADVCQAVIDRFEKDKRVKPDPQPDYSTRHYLNISQCKEWMGLNATLCQYVNDFTAAYFKRKGRLQAATHDEWTDDGYVVSRYDPGDACILHVDGQCSVEPQNGLRLATLIFYLNDVKSGGETSFPMQGVKVKPVRGRAVMFPVGFTHPHEVLKAKSPRYIMQTWITDPHFVVVERG